MPTTTTNNTNTTPLSAMTGEEVASILVGLIRQNDGVLIQQKVTDGINQSAYVTSYAALAADIVSGRAAIVARMRAAGVDIPANATYQQVADKLSQYLPLVATGCEFVSGYSNYDFGDTLLSPSNIKIFRANNVTSFSRNIFDGTNIEEINLPNVTSVNTQFNNLSSIKRILLPKLEAFGINYMLNVSGGNSLTKADFSSLKPSSSLGLSDVLWNPNKVNLIDLIIGKNFNANYNMSGNFYNPYNAYALNSSLCFDTDTTEYATEMARESRTTGFSNNREKWNFLLRQHFAYNLPDRTGLTAYTITFGSTLLAVMESATIAAFNNKNWTLA